MLVTPPGSVAEPVPEVAEIEIVIGEGLLVAPPLKLTETGTVPPTVTDESGLKVTFGTTFPPPSVTTGATGQER